MNCAILTLPGYTNAGPEHWMTIWERMHPGLCRVEQRDWHQPVLDEWVETLEQAVAATTGDVLLVAHSLGVSTVVHWSSRSGLATRVRGALLVAPPDVDRADAPPPVARFAPVPLVRLPFRSTVVLGTDDTWTSPARGRQMAVAWGSELIELEGVGHLDSRSGLGEWRAGWELLRNLP